MTLRLMPATKGLITASVMISVLLVLYSLKVEAIAWPQLLVYAIYATGIGWTLWSSRRSDAHRTEFGALFNQGFRCFVIVTLCMVGFYTLFNALHPEFAEQAARSARQEMTAAKDRLPTEIDTAVARIKKQYILQLVSRAIFGYLIIGALVTAALSALLGRPK